MAALQTERVRFSTFWQPTSVPQSSNGRPTGSTFKHEQWNQIWLWPNVELAYVENQKAASRTIRATLSQRFFAYPIRLMAPYSGNATIDQGKVEGIARRLENCSVVTFVRDPLTTFFSGYREVMSRAVSSNKWHGNGFKFMKTSCADGGTERVTSFLRDFLAGDAFGSEMFHVWPQALKLDVLDGRKFDFVGRVESLGEDLAELLQWQGKRLVRRHRGKVGTGAHKLVARGNKIIEGGLHMSARLNTTRGTHATGRANGTASSSRLQSDEHAACIRWHNASSLPTADVRTVCSLLAVDLVCLSSYTKGNEVCTN
jgi:hypothetical protein